MSYDDVDITNSTPYAVTGTVHYMSIFCKNDDYALSPAPKGHWSHSRGVCLITKIDAVVQAEGGSVDAEPYESSGTSYALFSVNQTGPTTFEVSRRVTGSEDVPPEGYVEPTEQQK